MPDARLADLQILPDEALIDIRDGVLSIQLGDRFVTLEVRGRHGVFATGPMSWKHLKARYILPALCNLMPRKER